MRLFYEAGESSASPSVDKYHRREAIDLHSPLIALAKTRFLLFRELTSALEIMLHSFRSLQYWLDVIFEECLSCSPVEALIWCSHDLIDTLSALSSVHSQIVP